MHSSAVHAVRPLYSRQRPLFVGGTLACVSAEDELRFRIACPTTPCENCMREWLRPGPCGLQRRCDRRAVPRSRPRSSGGCWFRWDFWRFRLTRKAEIQQRLGERVMPWASTMRVTTLMKQLQCLPHTGQSAGRRIVAGWVQREEEAFPCEVLCVSAVRHPSRTNSMCVGWRVAVVVAAIRICGKLRCGGGPVRPLPHE
ncbi:hypothetical protein TcCL_Unassigned05361 [Trypanosoma cruzi]|nr:hypothetical protein TcCL_Unassigned05361 [Trypanosoma cruzi]